MNLIKSTREYSHILKMQFLRFDSLRNIAGLRHAISTRGKVENDDGFSSFNLAYHVGDDAARVSRNRRALANTIGYDAEKLVAAQQVHGARVQVVVHEDAGRGAFSWDNAIIATDALVTYGENLPLMILVADCAPLLLVDDRARVLAVVHAGWRGAAGENRESRRLKRCANLEREAKISAPGSGRRCV